MDGDEDETMKKKNTARTKMASFLLLVVRLHSTPTHPADAPL